MRLKLEPLRRRQRMSVFVDECGVKGTDRHSALQCRMVVVVGGCVGILAAVVHEIGAALAARWLCPAGGEI